MSTTSLEFLWGLVIASSAFLLLAITLIVGVLIHSRKIKDSENRFRNLFARVFDALILLNSSGYIIDVNNATCKILKRSKEELLGISITGIIADDQGQAVLDGLTECLNNTRDYFEETNFIDSMDKKIPVEVGGTGFAINGDKYILGSFRDITERKESEEKIRKKNIALGHLIELLRGEKKQLKSQLAGELNHVILPLFSKIKNENGSINAAELDQLQNNIEQLAQGADIKTDVLKKLTPREVDIGQMIKAGSSSKEIAAYFNIAVETIHKHRENIRKKLGISDTNVRLRDYLLKNDIF
jgi:PAS domain S-box-containing protein